MVIVKQFKRTTVTNFTNIYSNLILLLIEDYEKGPLPKKPVITPFIERYETTTLRKFYL